MDFQFAYMLVCICMIVFALLFSCYKSSISNKVIIRHYGSSGSAGTVSNARSLLVKSGVNPMYYSCRPTPSRSCIQGLTVSKKLIYSPKKRKTMLVSCVKTSEAKETAKSNGEINFIFNVSSNESNLTVDVHHFILPGKFFFFCAIFRL